MDCSALATAVWLKMVKTAAPSALPAQPVAGAEPPLASTPAVPPVPAPPAPPEAPAAPATTSVPSPQPVGTDYRGAAGRFRAYLQSAQNERGTYSDWENARRAQENAPDYAGVRVFPRGGEQVDDSAWLAQQIEADPGHVHGMALSMIESGDPQLKAQGINLLTSPFQIAGPDGKPVTVNGLAEFARLRGGDSFDQTKYDTARNRALLEYAPASVTAARLESAAAEANPFAARALKGAAATLRATGDRTDAGVAATLDLVAANPAMTQQVNQMITAQTQQERDAFKADLSRTLANNPAGGVLDILTSQFSSSGWGTPALLIGGLLMLFGGSAGKLLGGIAMVAGGVNLWGRYGVITDPANPHNASALDAFRNSVGFFRENPNTNLEQYLAQMDGLTDEAKQGVRDIYAAGAFGAASKIEEAAMGAFDRSIPALTGTPAQAPAPAEPAPEAAK